MASRISSRSNALVRQAKLLATDAGARKAEGALIAEGIRLVEEALDAGCLVEHVLHSPRLTVTERGRALRENLERSSVRVTETTDGVLDSVSDAETSQGVLAIVRSPAMLSIPVGRIAEAASSGRTTDGDTDTAASQGSRLRAGAAPAATAPSSDHLVHPRRAEDAFWVVAWGLQDPGNVGTLLRSSDAAGVDLFVTLAGTADPTSPKAVRASAGSIFRVPLARGIAPDEILDGAGRCGINLFGTAPEGGAPYDRVEYPRGIGFVFGREGEGLPAAVSQRLHGTVTIPMRRGVESLNVAAAAAVVLFEVARRRSASAVRPPKE